MTTTDPDFTAALARNGWRIVSPPLDLAVLASDLETPAYAERVVSVQQHTETPTTLILWSEDFSRDARALACAVRDLLPGKEGARLFVCATMPAPAWKQWRIEADEAFALKYARSNIETAAAFWDRILLPPVVCRFAPPVPVFMPGQDPGHQVVILTGWNAANIAAVSNAPIIPDPAAGLSGADVGRAIRRLAHDVGDGRARVIPMLDTTAARYLTRVLLGSNINVGLYRTLPTESGFEANRVDA